MAQKKKSRKCIILTARDIEILKYLWLWKCSTFSALCDIFFPNTHPLKAYLRLAKLQSYGLVDQKVSNHLGKNLFTLAPLGFERILGHLPDLKESGFKSENLDHDFLVSAIHQGEWYSERPASVSLISEQVLRRSQPDSLPLWIPKGTLHRPDGYWYFSHEKGGQAVALEVELSRKERGRYADIQRYFEDQNQVSDVLWVTNQASLLKSIHDGLLSGRRLNLEKNSFVLLEDILSVFWQASIVAGKYKDHTIFQMFERILGKSISQTPIKTPVKSGSELSLQVNPHVLFDGRKSPPKPAVSELKNLTKTTLTPAKSHSIQDPSHVQPLIPSSSSALSPSLSQTPATSQNQSKSLDPALPKAIGEIK